MGKPKALRNRDVVPSIDINSSKSRKHKSFDEDGTDDVESTIKTSADNTQSDYNDDNNPEEVHKDNLDILKLKQLHEQMINPKRNKPKRKLTLHSDVVGDDVELDTSVLNSLDNLHKDENITEAMESIYEANDSRIDKMKSKSKKIGNIVVTVLKEDFVDPIASFKIQSSALEFKAVSLGNKERIKFSTFATQKKAGRTRR